MNQSTQSCRVVRRQLEGPAVAGHRFVPLSQLLQGIGQIVVCLGRSGLELDGAAVAGNRLVAHP